jgi:hypothetical protein
VRRSGSKGFPFRTARWRGSRRRGQDDSGSKGLLRTSGPAAAQQPAPRPRAIPAPRASLRTSPGGGATAGAEGKDDLAQGLPPNLSLAAAAAGAEGGDSSDGGGPVGAGAAAGGGGAAAGTQNGGGSSSLDVFSEKGVPDLLAPAAALDGGAKVEDSPIFGTARALSAEQPGDSLDVFAEAGSAQFGDTSLAGGRDDLGKNAGFKVEIEGIMATTPATSPLESGDPCWRTAGTRQRRTLSRSPLTEDEDLSCQPAPTGT